MKVLVIDDFLADPMAERNRALAAEFKRETHNGLTYRGIAKTQDPENTERLEKILGYGKAKEVIAMWRRYLASEESETYIHSDVQIGTFTAILYLSLPEQCKGGIAFWRHRTYGWHQQPAVELLTHQGLRDTPELWDSVWKDGMDEFKWEMTDYVPIHFNRMVIFYSPRFHSRYPKKSFGTDISNSRLIKTFFLKYDELKPQN